MYRKACLTGSRKLEGSVTSFKQQTILHFPGILTVLA